MSMNDSSQSPWPSIIKIALLIGCTMSFCILGLISGVLAAKVMQHASDARGDQLLVTVLMPPVVGALFGFFVCMVSTFYVRWIPRKTFGQPPFQPLAQPPVSTPSSQAPPPR
jgi:uncharacterized membrane protein YeaQ/YmgE (transglycosylase-associated protein family)